MLGPVTTAMVPPARLADRSQLLATKGVPCAFSAISTTGWRPFSMAKAPDASICGRVQSWVAATVASPAATSTAGPMSSAAMATVFRATAPIRTAKTRRAEAGEDRMRSRSARA